MIDSVAVANTGAKASVERLRPDRKSRRVGNESGVNEMSTEDLYIVVLRPEHRGKFVAVSNGGKRKKKIIAFGTHYSSVVKKAKKITRLFSIIPAPEKGTFYTC